jgi:histidinol-phosphate aminotransferase
MIEANSHLKRIQPYKPGKPIEMVVRELHLKGDIIKLASNENPLGPSPLALKAMRQAIRESQLYPDDNCFALRTALAGKFGVQPAEIVLGNGSVEILPQITLAYLGPGSSAVVSEGAFIWYKIAVDIAAGELIEVPMKDHAHDLRAMRQAIRSNTKLVFIANPNNPTGTIVPRDEVDEFFRALPDHVLVVMDEAYSEYIDDPRFPDSFSHFRAGKNILILRTFSKIYGLAGARLGYGFSRPEIIADLMKVRTSFNVNRISQAAGVAALGDVSHISRGRKVNDAGKALLYDAYRTLGLFHLPTWGNFIFVDFDRDSQTVFEDLQKRGIITRTIKEYGFPRALRITIGTEPQNQRLIRALKKVI